VRRAWLCIAVVVLAAAASGCRTAIGNYFHNRLRDLGDCVRLEGYAGPGLGVRVSAGGLVTTGLAYGAGVAEGGWRYGRLIGNVPQGDALVPIVMREKSVLFWSLEHHRGRDIHGMWARGSGLEWILFPALHSAIGAHEEWPIWHPFADESVEFAELHWARVHALDWEVSAWFGIAGFTVGFSPGEFADFILGWFGIDFARDDIPLRPWAPDDGARRRLEEDGKPPSEPDPPPGEDF
jgi:hypothetical protein